MSYNRSDHICYASAHECIRLAEITDDPDYRRELLELARRWRALALEEERTAALVPEAA
jgi:hypothetical protein